MTSLARGQFFLAMLASGGRSAMSGLRSASSFSGPTGPATRCSQRSLPVHDVEHRRRADAAVVVEEGVAAHRHRERVVALAPELAHLDRVLVDRQRDDLEALVAVLAVQPLDVGELHARRRAPGRPDHVHHDLAAQLLRLEELAAEEPDVQLGRRAVNLRDLTRVRSSGRTRGGDDRRKPRGRATTRDERHVCVSPRGLAARTRPLRAPGGRRGSSSAPSARPRRD